MNGAEFIKWFFVAYFAVNIILTVAWIGRPRKPITPGEAAFTVVLYGVWIALVLVLLGGA